MSAPLGTRQCPELGCGRRVHVTEGGTVWARCVAHGLALLNRSAFRHPDSDGKVAPSGLPTGAALALATGNPGPG